MRESTKTAMREIMEIGGRGGSDIGRRIETRADNIVASAVNLSNLIRETYGDAGEDLVARLMAAIKAGSADKFRKAVRSAEGGGRRA